MTTPRPWHVKLSHGIVSCRNSFQYDCAVLSCCCFVQVVRDKDADGFYLGELGGRRGLVPSNMVSPVDDATAAGRASSGVNHVTGGRLTDGGDPARAGKVVSPPSPRRHHRQNGRAYRLSIASSLHTRSIASSGDKYRPTNSGDNKK